MKLRKIVVRPITQRDMALYVLLMLYFHLSILIYKQILATTFSYQGFEDRFEVGNYAISISLLVSMFLTMRSKDLPSDVFLNLSAIAIVIPSLVLFTCAGLPAVYATTHIIGFFIIAAASKFTKFRAPHIQLLSQEQLTQLLIVMSLLIAAGVYFLGGSSYLNFNLANVYAVREEAALELPPVFAYLNSIATKVFIPFALGASLAKKRWTSAIILAALSISFFAMTAHKSPLFYPLVVASVYFLYRGADTSKLIVIALIGILVIAFVDGLLFLSMPDSQFGWIFSLLFRRALMVPVLANWNFIDFFQASEFVYWAESKITFGAITSPLEGRIVNVIGMEYFGNENMSANTGWIGSGYANAGIIGVAIYSILIGLIFAVLDAYAQRISTRLIIAMFTLLVFTMLASADFVTMLLTHGLLAALLLLLFIRPSSDQSH